MKLLITVDGSSFSEETLGVARPLAMACRADVHLLTVGPVPRQVTQWAYVGKPPREHETALAEAERELSSYLHSLASHLEGLPVTCKVILHDSAAEEIIDYAARENADLIVMATHGRTGLAEAIMGSVCHKVVASGVAPVLLVRPKRLAEKGEAREAALRLPG
jgi:nucleotide-binding universal stress UspA family protein